MQQWRASPGMWASPTPYLGSVELTKAYLTEATCAYLPMFRAEQHAINVVVFVCMALYKR